MPVESKHAGANSESQQDTQRCPLPPLRSGAKYSKVLLLDGYSTRTLACVRSWGKKGVAFAVGGESRWDMSLMSPFAKEPFVYTSQKTDARKFIEDVNRYCRELRADCIFPTSEAGIMACSEHRKELVCDPIIPSEREIETIFSKDKTLAMTHTMGITAP